jgi:N-acetylmuramoyl-L-alanine amidase
LIAEESLGRGYKTPTLSPKAVGASFDEPYCSLPVDSLAKIAGDEPLAVTDSVVAVAVETPLDEPTAADSGATVAGESSVSPEGCAVVEVATQDDTTRVPLPLDVWIQGDQPVIELHEQSSAAGSDGFIVGRAARNATTLWMWAPQMRARVTGRRNGALRLGLDGQTEAWVALDEAVWLHGVTLPARARVGTVRFEGRTDHLRARVVLPYPVPYQVEIEGKRLTLILYGAYSNTDWLRYGASDPYLRSAVWEQASSDRYLLHIELTERPWGYRVDYDSGSLILDIRKPPGVNDKNPLSGRRIAVDPGHPPAGSTGPTRLYEADANLAIANQLKKLLDEEGATVFMTRTDSSSVRLYDRTRYAEMMDAEILVSIHNNALPDGVNPFENNGTRVFYLHPGSLDLAHALQRNLLKTMALRDLGIGRASLALARPSWMPAVLTEGAFMMIPEQEAALRDPAFQEAYARGILEGLREFLTERSE